MFFPKLNSVFYPSLGICTNTEPKTMTGIPIFPILDFYSSVSHALNTSLNGWYIDDSIILAYRDKSRRIVYRKG